MAVFVLIVSAIFGMLSFGSHMWVLSREKYDRPLYLKNTFLSIIPLACGLILPAIAFLYVFNFHWAIIFVVNFVLVLLLARPLATLVLLLFWRGRNAGIRVFVFFICSVITLALGIALFYLLA